MSACPVCGGTRGRAFFETRGVPVLCNVLHPDAESARAVARADLRLAWCPDCAMVWNAAFDPRLVRYDPSYDASLDHSPHFRAYAAGLAQRLRERHRLDGAHVVEVGCGKGEFLRLLADGGRNRCTGFDAGYEGAADDDAGVTIHRAFYDPAVHGPLEADLAVCRHVLEHLAEPGPFLDALVAAVRPGGALYLEVPDALFTLREGGIWDLIYEHCGYFTAPALDRLCRDHGVAPLAIESTYCGQFLSLDGVAGEAAAPAAGDGATVGALAEAFATRHRETVGSWARVLDAELDRGARIAVWGAGSKGVTFLNTVPRAGEIAAVVDRNPRKHGRHVAGTGQQVTAPESLARDGCDLVVATNPVYRAEIEAELQSLGLDCPVRAAT